MYLPREAESVLISAVKNRKNVLLRGPRQAGKTTLLKHIAKKLDASYYTLDKPATLKQFEKDPDSLIENNCIFIDEIQESKNAGRILRYLVDSYPDTTFIFSGSGGFDLKLNVSKYLVGRAVEYTLLPLSFSEFVRWKNQEAFNLYIRYRKILVDFLRHKVIKLKIGEVPQLEVLLEEYLQYGGYPKVVLSKDKDTELKNLSSAIIERDIITYFGLKQKQKLLDFIKILAYNAGKLLKYAFLNVDYKTALEYLNILESNFIIKLLPAYAKNPTIEVRKAKKVMFYDNGFRRHFSHLEEGFVLEQFVFRQLLPNYYWRDKKGHEVDFVLENIPVEVKRSARKSAGLKHFIKKYRPKRALVIHVLWEAWVEEIDECSVLHWPIYLI